MYFGAYVNMSFCDSKEKKVNDINEFYKYEIEYKLNAKLQETNFCYDFVKQLTTKEICNAFKMLHENNKIIIHGNDFMISPGYGQRVSEYGRTSSVLCHAEFLVLRVKDYKKICCNIKNYSMYRDKCIDLYNHYTNVIINIENTKENKDVYPLVIEDAIKAYTANPKAFECKLILFPINKDIYYFAKSFILEFKYIKDNFGNRLKMLIGDMKFNY